MTDKEVIINGIDVSKCVFNYSEICCEIDEEYCFKDNNCYYKQLKHKEQECKKINSTNERLIAEKYALNEEILRLKKKKEENEKFYLTKYANKDSYCLELEHERNQYKQALDEIEEFCIVYSNNHDAYETVYKHILDIIKKVKENE